MRATGIESMVAGFDIAVAMSATLGNQAAMAECDSIKAFAVAGGRDV